MLGKLTLVALLIPFQDGIIDEFVKWLEEVTQDVLSLVLVVVLLFLIIGIGVAVSRMLRTAWPMVGIVPLTVILQRAATDFLSILVLAVIAAFPGVILATRGVFGAPLEEWVTRIFGS